MTQKAIVRATAIFLRYMILLLLAVFIPVATSADTVQNDFMIDSSAEEGAKIYIRERHAQNIDPATINKAVLFVHGATYSGATFDIDIDGYGWMKHATDNGFVAYYLDVRGYGNSTRFRCRKNTRQLLRAVSSKLGPE